MYADVIIDITHEKLDKIFQYMIPQELEGKLKVGMEVSVPFGRGDTPRNGYIVGFSEKCDYDIKKMKTILEPAKNRVAVESNLVELAAWMKEFYGGTMIQALKTVLPIKKEERRKEERILRRRISVEDGKERLEQYLHKNQKARARLMAALLDDAEIPFSLVSKKLNITLPVVKALEEQGVLEIISRQVYRNPLEDREVMSQEVSYTSEQIQAIECFKKDYASETYHTYLLYGITGSGKTEVYIEMIQQVVNAGRQAIADSGNCTDLSDSHAVSQTVW